MHDAEYIRHQGPWDMYPLHLHSITYSPLHQCQNLFGVISKDAQEFELVLFVATNLLNDLSKTSLTEYVLDIEKNIHHYNYVLQIPQNL